MAINITQFAPPSRVSSLVWDKNMEPPAGKVFEGDLVGDVTGDVTGDLTGNVAGNVTGSVLGYLSRNGVVSASSGVLVAPASSSIGNTPTRVDLSLGGDGTYVIIDNTLKCFLSNPCLIPIAVSYIPDWGISEVSPSATSYTADNKAIHTITYSGNLNIYGAAYIVLSGGTYRDDEWGSYDRTMSIADTYIDAGTSLILGDDTPPDGPKVSKLVWDSDMQAPAGKKFKGALEGNVTGNVTGHTTYEWSISPRDSEVTLRSVGGSLTQIYQVSPTDTITGTIRAYIRSTPPPENVYLLCISANWDTLSYTQFLDTSTTYTLPKGTNGIYILNEGLSGICIIKMSRFVVK